MLNGIELIELVMKHGYSKLSDSCETCIKIKKGIEEIQNAINIQKTVERIDIEKLIETVHQMDMKTPVVGNSRSYFVDMHYKLVGLRKILERK